MKHLTLFLFAALTLNSCKKSESAPKEILLSAILQDGKLQYSFFYDDQNRLYQYDIYNQAGTTLAQIVSIEYETDDRLKGFTGYSMPGNVPIVRVLYEYNDMGQLVGGESYQLQGPTPNTPNLTVDYTYNAAGRLSVIHQRNKDGDLTTRTNYSYFPDGNLKEANKYKPSGNLLWQSGKISYSLPGTTEIKGMDAFAEVVGTEAFLMFMGETQHYYSYDQNGGISNYFYVVLSHREMNADGTIKRHLSTRTNVTPEGDDELKNYSFEYITQ